MSGSAPQPHSLVLALVRSETHQTLGPGAKCDPSQRFMWPTSNSKINCLKIRMWCFKVSIEQETTFPIMHVDFTSKITTAHH